MIYRSMAHLPIMGPKRRRKLPKEPEPKAWTGMDIAVSTRHGTPPELLTSLGEVRSSSTLEPGAVPFAGYSGNPPPSARVEWAIKRDGQLTDPRSKGFLAALRQNEAMQNEAILEAQREPDSISNAYHNQAIANQQAMSYYGVAYDPLAGQLGPMETGLGRMGAFGYRLGGDPK